MARTQLPATQIQDSSIKDADIASDANIAISKIAGLNTALSSKLDLSWTQQHEKTVLADADAFMILDSENNAQPTPALFGDLKQSLSGGMGGVIQFNTIADMVAYTPNYVPAIGYVLASGKHYMFIDSWRETISLPPVDTDFSDPNIKLMIRGDDFSDSLIGTRLSTLNDSSYLGNDIIKHAGTAPMLTSDGTHKYLNFDNYASFDTNVFNATDDIHMFMVFRPQSLSQSQFLTYSMDQETTSKRLIISASGSPTGYLSIYDQPTWYSESSQSQSTVTTNIISFKCRIGEALRAYIGTVERVNSGSHLYSATRVWTNMLLFGNPSASNVSMLGRLYEIRIYKNLNDASFNTVINKLQAYYGL